MAKSLIKQLGDASGDNEELAPGWCLVVFGARWCTPCTQLTPIIEALARKYEGRVSFYAYDMDRFNLRALRLNVKGVPTLVLLHEGWMKETLTGFRSLDMIETMILKHIECAASAAALT